MMCHCGTLWFQAYGHYQLSSMLLKPRSNQNSQRREGGVSLLVCECLVNEVEFIISVKCDESVWMKVHGGK